VFVLLFKVTERKAERDQTIGNGCQEDEHRGKVGGFA
jgi:hypothetical protein